MKIEPCTAKRVGECELTAGHDGDHMTRKGGAFGRTIHVWNEAHEIDPAADDAEINSWQCCASRAGGHKCERPMEHDVAHAAVNLGPTGTSNFVVWESSTKGGKVLRFLVRSPVDALLSKPPASRKAVGVETSEPSLADICSKCGRELGEHQGKKCPPTEKKPDEEQEQLDFDEVRSTTGFRTPAPLRIFATEGDEVCGERVHKGRGRACDRIRGHEGNHRSREGGTWPNKAAGATPAKPPQCPSRIRQADTGKVAKDALQCDLEVGHDGAHRAKAREGKHIAVWGDKTNGSVWIPIGQYDDKTDRLTYVDEAYRPPAKAKTKEKRPATVEKAEQLHREHRTTKAKKPKKPAKPVKQMAPAKAPPAKKPEPEPPPAPNARILGFKVHPVAAKYPLIEGSDFVEFCDDIKANGQRDKIVLVDIGKETYILDGRNRGRACEVLKIKPRFESYSGPTDEASLKAFAISKNDHRRHYSKGVRALVAADLADLGQGERKTGKSAGVTQAQAAKIEHISERLVRLARAVKNKGTALLREAVMRDKLALDAAADAAIKLSTAKQNEIAEKALAKGGNSVVKLGQIRMLIRQEGKRATVAKINKGQVRPLTGGPYRLIYIDWPWQYDNNDQHEGSKAHTPYPTLPMDRIHKAAEDIKRVALDEELVLAMWVTNHFVWAIGDVLKVLGFERNDAVITWDKGNPGVGRTGPRGQTEHLVLAWRKGAKHTLNELSTIIEAPRREHSRKPDVFAELLHKHCAGPHLEMFAQEEREGWDVWGAETKKYEAAA